GGPRRRGPVHPETARREAVLMRPKAMHSAESRAAAAAAPNFVLDRREALPALIGRHEDFLIIGGLAGAARDIAALTRNGPNGYAMGGAMGGACMIGLGLAL